MKRICRCCKKEFDIDFFVRRKKGKGGFSYRCKDCQRAKNVEYREYRRKWAADKRRNDSVWHKLSKESSKKYRNSSQGLLRTENIVKHITKNVQNTTQSITEKTSRRKEHNQSTM